MFSPTNVSAQLDDGLLSQTIKTEKSQLEPLSDCMGNEREILIYNRVGAYHDSVSVQLKDSNTKLKKNISGLSLNENNNYCRSSKSSPCPSKADSDLSLPSHRSEECLLCLDGFAEDNVRMQPVNTICACGVNKIKIHRQCLDIYKRKYSECPYCKEYFFFE